MDAVQWNQPCGFEKEKAVLSGCVHDLRADHPEGGRGVRNDRALSGRAGQEAGRLPGHPVSGDGLGVHPASGELVRVAGISGADHGRRKAVRRTAGDRDRKAHVLPGLYRPGGPEVLSGRRRAGRKRPPTVSDL